MRLVNFLKIQSAHMTFTKLLKISMKEPHTYIDASLFDGCANSIMFCTFSLSVFSVRFKIKLSQLYKNDNKYYQISASKNY